MKSKRVLSKLLSNYDDLDQEFYFLIKQELQNNGITFFINWPVDSLIKKDQSLSMAGLIAALPIKIISEQDDFPLILRKKNEVNVPILSDEKIQLTLWVGSRKWGPKIFTLNDLRKGEGSPLFRFSKFLQYELQYQSVVKVSIKVPEFSNHRQRIEQNSYLVHSREYVELLKNEQFWKEKFLAWVLDQETDTQLLLTRIRLWNICQIPQPSSDLVDRCSLALLPFNNIYILEEFIINFFQNKYTNEDLFKVPHERVLVKQKFLKEIGVNYESN